MRLIDADALPYENLVLSTDEEWCLKAADIDAAPTIEQPTWIPVTERLPTEEDATNFGLVLAVFEDGKADAWLWHTVADEPERFEKWKPIFALLQPSKGDG